MILIRKVKGHSLEPQLRDGQIVVFIRSKKKIPNSIVIARYKNKEVVKILKTKNESQVYLAGSSQRHDVGWVEEERLIGRLVWPRINLGVY